MRQMEERLKELDIDKIEDISNIYVYLEDTQTLIKSNEELVEAEKFAQKVMDLARIHRLRDLELVSMLDYACLMIENEDFLDALNLLMSIKDEQYIHDAMYGHVLDEIGISLIHLGKCDDGKNMLDMAWNWLCERNDDNEFGRNCYGIALYFLKKADLDLAYAFADMAYKRDQNLLCLMLLYEVCLIKYIIAQRMGKESEYAFYRSEYDRYKLQLERRGNKC